MEFFSTRYSNPGSDYEDPRRDFLVKALTMGLFAVTGSLRPTDVVAMGERPHQLPPGRSVFTARGDVLIDGVAATRDSVVGTNARIQTGSDSELVFVMGKDAFILRENSEIELAPLQRDGGGGGAKADGLEGAILGGLRLLSGKILTVFGERGPAETLSIDTPIATIGVRGTGIYVESAPDHDYVCTCYGMTLLQSASDERSREQISTSYHDSPRYILDAGAKGKRIQPAPVINHTDMELVLIERLVGRKPPFWPLDSGY